MMVRKGNSGKLVIAEILGNSKRVNRYRLLLETLLQSMRGLRACGNIHLLYVHNFFFISSYLKVITIGCNLTAVNVVCVLILSTQL